MAKTVRELTSNGVQSVYPIDFALGYLDDRELVYVYTGSDYTTQIPYTWVDDNNIELNPVPADGVEFTIRRVVPRDALVNNYVDDANLREEEVNQSFLQVVMLFEEVEDGYMSVVPPWIVNGDINMAGNSILNLAEIQAEDIKNLAGDSLLALAQQYSDAAATSAAEASTSAANAQTAENNAGLNVTYAAEWANKAEDSLVSAAAGGDEVDDYSAKHHAAKAQAAAASVPVDALVPADIGVTVQAHDPTILVDADIGAVIQAYDIDTAKTDAAQDWTKPQRGPADVNNDLNFDLALKNNYEATPTGSATLTFSVSSGTINGQSGFLLLDNSGGFVIGKAASIKTDDTFLSTISEAGVYLISYYAKSNTEVFMVTSRAMA